jgi:hypothetical protein
MTPPSDPSEGKTVVIMDIDEIGLIGVVHDDASERGIRNVVVRVSNESVERLS